MTPFCNGFRIVGTPAGHRQLVDAPRAFAAYAANENAAECHKEAYLSAFQYGAEMTAYVTANRGSVAGYVGPTHSPWLWFDIDQTDPEAARADAAKLVGRTLHRYPSLDEDGPLIFYSGGKGYHVGFPLALFGSPAPSPDFHAVCRRTAETVAGHAGGVVIDTAIYNQVHPFRAPNSWHPRTGLRKRRLSHAELFGLSAERHRQLAADPLPFDVPADSPAADPVAVADWTAAATATAKQSERTAATPVGERPLQRDTIYFVNDTDTPDDGIRNERTFRAAANLTEHGTPAAVVTQLVTGPARAADLSPSEAAKAIASGIAHAARKAVTP